MYKYSSPFLKSHLLFDLQSQDPGNDGKIQQGNKRETSICSHLVNLLRQDSRAENEKVSATSRMGVIENYNDYR